MKRVIFFIVVFALASTAYACNIPVFRYALERWQPGSCELIVFHDAPLSTEGETFVRALESAALENKGSTNAKIVRSNIELAKQDSYQPVLETLRKSQPPQTIKLPYVVVRTNLGRGRTINNWHGSLNAARSANLLQSPARKEISRRLLRGDSIVWLLLRSSDKKKSDAARDLLKQNFEALQKKVQLPEGIGLPGSELHSEVPLLVKFSLLEIDPGDPKEQYLVKLLTGFEPKAVFGRARALEVIPARDLTDRLIEEMTLFLSGACSCQVKEQNPGFDLLMTEDWDTQLFGEDGIRPPPAKTVGDRKQPPELLTIPPGRGSGK
jgi:hypothetical protein